MAPLGVRFHGTAEVWDSVADPDSGLVTLGVPLWSGHTSKDAADDTPSLLYAVGQHAFVLAKCLDKLEQQRVCLLIADIIHNQRVSGQFITCRAGYARHHRAMLEQNINRQGFTLQVFKFDLAKLANRETQFTGKFP